MKICLLASGSKGNAILVESGQTRLLIDAGLSAREIRRRLDLVGVDAESLTALLITHEHTDHVRGLGPLVRQLDIPVYLQSDLARRLSDVGKNEYVREFVDGEDFTVNDLTVRPFAVTHDSLAPVGFTLTGELGKIGIEVELCYVDERHDQVRITGIAEVVTDRALLEEIWAENPLLGQFLGSIDNPEFMLYRVVPERVRFMREWALEYFEVPLG